MKLRFKKEIKEEDQEECGYKGLRRKQRRQQRTGQCKGCGIRQRGLERDGQQENINGIDGCVVFCL